MADAFMDDGLSSMRDDGSFSSTEGSEVASTGRVEPRTPDPVPMIPSVFVPECFLAASYNMFHVFACVNIVLRRIAFKISLQSQNHVRMLTYGGTATPLQFTWMLWQPMYLSLSTGFLCGATFQSSFGCKSHMT